MMSATGFMQGTCFTMCPRGEMLFREKEKLLHRFEMKSGTESDKKPKADPDKVIKRYRRSAAGTETISSDLRPFPILMKTVRYLFRNIFTMHRDNPVVVYNFMFDRLRSVRQDIVIQGLPAIESISLLEPIARFHIYFGYYLIEESEANFDFHINSIHLQECLKQLLVCYDECQMNVHDLSDEMARLTLCELDLKNRNQIEGAYLLFNLSHFEALSRGVRLTGIVLDDELLKISFAWYLKNYVRVLNLMKNLPPLLLCIVAKFIPEIRKYSLQAMSQAFSSSNCLYPVSHLRDLLLYENDAQLISDCYDFNIQVKENHVIFLKKNFNFSHEVQKSKKLSWIDDRLLKCDLVNLLLCGSE